MAGWGFRTTARVLAAMIAAASPAFTQTEGTSAAPAVPAPAVLDPAQRTRALELISRLNSDDFGQREQATAALKSLGAAVRPLLSQAMATASPEVRLRLGALIDHFPQRGVTVDVRLEPTRLALPETPSTVGALIARLETQGDLRFAKPLPFDLDRPWRQDLDGVPLLEALDRVAAVLEKSWSFDYRTNEVMLRPGAAGRPLCCYVGPFRFALNSVTRNSTVLFGGDSIENCYGQGQITLEPAAAVLGAWIPPRIDEVVDDRGRSLVLEEQRVRSSFTLTTQRRAIHLTLRVKPPEREVEKIGLVRGSLTVAVPVRYETASVTIPEKGKTAEAHSGTLTVRVTGRLDAEDETTLLVELEREPVFADDAQRQPVLDQAFDFQSAGGQPIQPLALPVRQQSGKIESFRIRLPRSAAASLTVRSLTEVARKKVAFEFRDVPLP